MEKAQFQILAEEINALVDQAISSVPIDIPKPVLEVMGATFCVAMAYFSCKNSPRAYLGGATVGFIASMKHMPDHPLKNGLKRDTLLSVRAEDGMSYQKALPLLWLLGWNWGCVSGFLAGHTLYHLGKTHIDSSIEYAKEKTGL